MSINYPGVQAIAYHFQKISSNTPDLQTLDKLIQQQQNLSRHLDLGKSFYMIIDYTQWGYQYVSDSLIEVLGYTIDYPMKKKLDFMQETVHPADALCMVKLWEAITAHCKTLSATDFAQSTYTVDYRLRHADGHYCHILQQTMMMETDEQGQFLYELVKLTDIGHWQKESPIMGIVSTPNPEDNLIGIPTEDIWLRGRIFSEAEQQVLEELALGLRSKAIAQKLNRSVHTVDTHRRSMLRKTKSRNTQELLRFAHLTGIL